MARVSIVMPARRPDPRYFVAAVDSILAQTMADFELLVVEDAGDTSAKSLLQNYADARIRHIVNASPGGLGAALNAGIAASRSELIARLDTDDIALPQRLAEQVAMFEREPALAVAGSQSAIIDEETQVVATRRYPTEPHEIRRSLMRFNCLCHPSVMFRRSAITDLGGYRAAGVNEDYDLWCRVAAAGLLIRNHPDELVHYRFHAGALKRQNVGNVIRSGIEIKRRYFGPILDLRARLRLTAERLLLILPEALVVELFRRITYAPRPDAGPTG